MNMKFWLGAACAALTMNVFAADYVVGQKNKAFSPVFIKIKVGDTINFVNEDRFFHNVFSLSDVESFDLGSYPLGQGRKVTFNKRGQVQVECAIHPFMKMRVEVVN